MRVDWRRAVQAQMPLLKTKLFVPPVQGKRIERLRLIRRLDEGRSVGLTLISAPAGSGKTTLLGEWCAAAGTGNWPIVWLSLDKGDNDPNRFWIYFISALQGIRPGIGKAALEMVGQLEAVPQEFILSSIVNDVLQVEEDFSFVLDDYHLISSESIQESMAFLMDHLPPRMHLIISGRSIPALPLARLRIQKQVVEICAEELRFTSEEVSQYLEQFANSPVSMEVKEMLEARTEGWVVGVQLAVISLNRQENPESLWDASGGDNPHVFEYLVEEVLEQQPEPVRNFLRYTSVLNRLSGPLCDAVLSAVFPGLEWKPGQEMLEELQKDNLFIVPLDDQRQWYRYHHLFSDVLRNDLKRKHPELPAKLHRHAAVWFRENRLPLEAVEQLLKAEDWEHAGQLICDSAWQTLTGNGQWGTLKYWIKKLPVEVLENHPRLYAQYAFALLITGELAAAQYYLDLAAQDFKQNNDLQGAGELYTVYALLLRYRSDATGMIGFAHKALSLLPKTDLLHRSLAMNCLGTGYYLNGETRKAELALKEALAMADLSGNLMASYSIENLLGRVAICQGELKEAARRFEKVFSDSTTGKQYAPMTATFEACFQLGKIYYQWDDLERAIDYLQTGIALSEQIGSHPHASYGYIKLAHALFSSGEQQASIGAIELAEMTARQLDTESRIQRSQAYKAWLGLRGGRHAEARHWLSQFEARTGPEVFFDWQVEALVADRIYLAQEKPEAALALLEPLEKLARENRREGDLFEILALKALALQLQSRPEEALRALAESVALAAPSEYLRFYVDEGPAMMQLLLKLSNGHDAPAYVQDILAAFDQDKFKEVVSKKGESPITPGFTSSLAGRLIEPLSRREIEVIRLVYAVYSNREIAQALTISEGTVKRHLHNIYQKLNVSNRRQAVVRARALNLL